MAAVAALHRRPGGGSPPPRAPPPARRKAGSAHPPPGKGADTRELRAQASKVQKKVPLDPLNLLNPSVIQFLVNHMVLIDPLVMDLKMMMLIHN